MTQPEPKAAQADLSLVAVTILVVGFFFASLAAVSWLLGHLMDRPVGAVEIPLGAGAVFATVGAGTAGRARARRFR